MRNFKLILLIITILGTLAGCANSSKITGITPGTEVKTVIVGTGNSIKPVAYLDENGDLTGFEPALLAEIDKRLPQYEFKVESLDFANILISLDAGKIDLAAHNYAKNEDRVAKYQYGEEAYSESDFRMIIDKTREDINTVDDLTGKKVYVDTGSNNAYLAEKYNQEHNNVLNISYGTLDFATLAQNLTNGTYDATFGAQRQVDEVNNALGEKLKIVGDPVYRAGVYYIVKKDANNELIDAVDSVIREMKADGSLATLLLKWYSEAAIPSDAVRK